MFDFKIMNKDYANQMSLWDYKGEFNLSLQAYYDSYDSKTNSSKGPANCDGYAVFLEGELFGLFEYYFKTDGITIGLAMNPYVIGKGKGCQFVNEGIDFAIKQYDYKNDYIKLFVKKDNLRAITVYKKIGFITTGTVYDDLGKLDCYEMKKYLKS